MKGGKRDGIGIMAAGKRRGREREEPRWPFRNQVLPTSVPARKNNLSSQTSLPPSPPSKNDGADYKDGNV